MDHAVDLLVALVTDVVVVPRPSLGLVLPGVHLFQRVPFRADSLAATPLLRLYLQPAGNGGDCILVCFLHFLHNLLVPLVDDALPYCHFLLVLAALVVRLQLILPPLPLPLPPLKLRWGHDGPELLHGLVVGILLPPSPLLEGLLLAQVPDAHTCDAATGIKVCRALRGVFPSGPQVAPETALSTTESPRDVEHHVPHGLRGEDIAHRAVHSHCLPEGCHCKVANAVGFAGHATNSIEGGEDGDTTWENKVLPRNGLQEDSYRTRGGEAGKRRRHCNATAMNTLSAIGGGAAGDDKRHVDG
eukprot:Sspe_Gene.16659::Locus_5878_Transcript_1_1_Confidence_1.000_Length_1685::g.16659::m.16659